jgi:hypothetical protein
MATLLMLAAGCVNQYKNRQCVDVPPEIARNLKSLCIIQTIYDSGDQVPTTTKNVIPTASGIPGL